MNTVVRECINFKMNDNGMVDVLEGDKVIGEVELGVHALLTLFNGYMSDDNIIEILSELTQLDKDKAKKMFDKITENYKYILEKKDSVFRNFDVFINSKQKVNLNRLRAIVPKFLVLSLTRDCFMQCRYCYAGARYCENIDEAKGLEIELIDKILKDAKKLGIRHIEITGGDPFIRKDIYEILQKTVEEEIHINISTKKLLSIQEIKQLKQTGLKSIQISIDTLDDYIAKYLTGIDDFAERMIEVISKLISNGIDVTVNTVVTKKNIKGIPVLITKLNNMGVKEHMISPYLRTLGRHDELLFPDEEDYKLLEEFIYNYEGKMNVNYKSPKYEIKSKTLMNIPRCSGGRMGLVIIPNGKVTICERLIDSEECIIGDVKKQSLIDIWNSDELYNLIYPKRSKFINTDCYDCDDYEKCILDKGLCYARSKIAYGTIYNKDPLCPRETKFVRFV